ncbi:ABC transporter ATP-binding protein [Peptacetobacter sp.]|uniref:ABC transporter ATP-binding protein n=1 Tax=Peptacetobacter sp. TaxID=2991975 RepID=UPI002E79DE8E|nr:ABC transporter ATP-binding protein [Peptacetobacter sp.]MEE0450483.1 ABC transporter ATP-binding protein [Peptacetobacter sp.]
MNREDNKIKELNSKIRIENISKSFDGDKIIDNISINVEEGELVSILGPSGCGKSTIFNIIAGLLKQDSGKVDVNGKLSYMYQKDLLLPYKTIIDNVSLPLVLRKEKKSEAREEVRQYFKVFGLEGYEDKYPKELSGGMRQRANFMRTYVNSNDIMLLDEPFGALDSITKSSMQKWLLDIRKKVTSTILLITHDIEEAILLSDRIYVISNKPSSVSMEIVVDRDRIGDVEYSFKLKKDILDVLHI